MRKPPSLVTIDLNALASVTGGSSTKTKNQEPDKEDIPTWGDDIKRIAKSGGKPRTDKEKESERNRKTFNTISNTINAFGSYKAKK
ncbi:MAG: hypothetical protein AB7P03_26370 [Kofleriaceae bacterium]